MQHHDMEWIYSGCRIRQTTSLSASAGQLPGLRRTPADPLQPRRCWDRSRTTAAWLRRVDWLLDILSHLLHRMYTLYNNKAILVLRKSLLRISCLAVIHSFSHAVVVIRHEIYQKCSSSIDQFSSNFSVYFNYIFFSIFALTMIIY